MVVFVEHMSEDTDWHGTKSNFASFQGAASRERDSGDSESRAVPRARRIALLNRVVAAEILPRLALAKQAAARKQAENLGASVSLANATNQLVRLLLSGDDAGAGDFVAALREAGASAEVLYIGVLSEAARGLGVLWEEDRCDFVKVTIALGRLQQIARSLSPGFQTGAVKASGVYSILLLPASGDQHTFGLVILAEFFQRAGWHVGGGPLSSGPDAAVLARDTWFDVVGFSVGSIAHVEILAKSIRRLRELSRNPAVFVMVGGPLILTRPELLTHFGADATASDAPDAVHQANVLVAARDAAT